MPVSAHPADMYIQDQAISISPDGLQIDWKIFPGPILADAVWATVAQSDTSTVSQEAARAWLGPFLAELSVGFDGSPLDRYQVRRVHWPASIDVMRTGEDQIGITLFYAWPVHASGKHALEIHNAHVEANSLNTFSLTGEQGLTFDLPAQKNGLLQVDLYFPRGTGSSPSPPPSTLSSWSSGTPNLPDLAGGLSRLAVNLAAPPQTAAQTPPAASTASRASSSSITSALTGLVKTQQFSPLFLAGAFLLSLALGSLHALTPGHGKALVGAYLVGSHGKTRDAVFLGTIVTVTHTGTVVLLGLLTLFASHYILPALIAPWLEIISGLLVIGFGLNLLLRRRRNLVTWLQRGERGLGPFPTHRRRLTITRTTTRTPPTSITIIQRRGAARRTISTRTTRAPSTNTPTSPPPKE
jgi:hypothetical protein